jgi:hypothetical protein
MFTCTRFFISSIDPDAETHNNRFTNITHIICHDWLFHAILKKKNSMVDNVNEEEFKTIYEKVKHDPDLTKILFEIVHYIFHEIEEKQSIDPYNTIDFIYLLIMYIIRMKDVPRPSDISNRTYKHWLSPDECNLVIRLLDIIDSPLCNDVLHYIDLKKYEETLNGEQKLIIKQQRLDLIDVIKTKLLTYKNPKYKDKYFHIDELDYTEFSID